MSTVIDTTRRRGPQPGSGSPKQALVNATSAWGSDVAEWLVTLAEACDRTSQGHVARQLGYSGSVISAVLNRTYKGSLDAVEKAVRGALMAETLECPVLGELRKDRCLEHQKKAQHFTPTSSLRVQIYRHCKGGCIHSRLSGGDHAQS